MYDAADARPAASGRRRRRRAASNVESDTSDEDAPLLRPCQRRLRQHPNTSLRSAVHRRVRRRHARINEEEVDNIIAEARADDSDSDISEDNPLLLSSRPKSAARQALASHHVESDTESDRAVNNRLPVALESSEDEY